MKLGNKLSFGIQAVVAGQKNAVVNAAPQLIVNSTAGKFTITSPVSKAMNIAAGENIMFLNNISGVENAIQSRVDEIVAYANENGIDLNTREGEDTILKAFTQWFIAKGVPQYTKTGAPVMANERLTKAEKEKYLDANRMTIVEANREALVEVFGDMSDEELAEKLTIDIIESPKYHACSGSKTAANGNNTGVGLQLGFTDSAIWNTLKADLGDEASKKNRIYNVLLSDAVDTQYFDGFKNVNITIFPIEYSNDTDVIVRGVKNED